MGNNKNAYLQEALRINETGKKSTRRKLQERLSRRNRKLREGVDAVTSNNILKLMAEKNEGAEDALNTLVRKIMGDMDVSRVSELNRPLQQAINTLKKYILTAKSGSTSPSMLNKMANSSEGAFNAIKVLSTNISNISGTQPDKTSQFFLDVLKKFVTVASGRKTVGESFRRRLKESTGGRAPEVYDLIEVAYDAPESVATALFYALEDDSKILHDIIMKCLSDDDCIEILNSIYEMDY